MAYQKEPYRILAGSLNLLPPTDKTPPEDSLELTNWRVDQAGQLKSRKGMSHVSGFLTGNRGHTMFRQSPNRRYLGADGTLYAGDGAGNYSSIATGFDGQALGMEAMAAHTWIMNQAKQGKESYTPQAGGGGFQNWLPAPPSSALTAAAGAQSSVTLATFNTGEAWGTMTDPNGDLAPANLTFDSSEFISGQSLHFECNPTGTWSADFTAFAVKDCSIAGAQQASDKFRIWVFCSDPAALSSIQILVDVNTRGFDLDYYSVYIPASSLNQGARTWTHLEISRDAAALTNEELSAGAHAFVRQGSTADKDWRTVSGIRLTVKTNEACDVQFDTFDVIGGLNAGNDGDYTFFTTFDTAAGHESNPSPESASVTVDHQGIALTNIPTSTDSQVTKRHIYMSGGGLSEPLRVATIGDNSTTAYTLLTSDDTAQAENTTMPIDHDPPPAGLGLVWHLGKLIAFNSVAHPGRFWWTPTARPWYFPGSDDEAEGNWQDTGEDADEILGATSHNRTLIFYKRRKIWRLYGDPDESDPEPTSASMGIFGPQAFCKAGSVDYAAGGEGIYRFNAESETKISTKIDPIFKGEYAVLSTVSSVAVLTIPPIDANSKDKCCLGHINGRLYFSYPSNGSSVNDVTLVCELDTLRWSQLKLTAPNNGQGGFSAFYYEGQDRGLMGATSTIAGAQVNLLEAGLTDNTTAIPLVWHSCYHDHGLPDNPKQYGELVITYKTGDQNGTTPLTVSLYYNNGQSNVAVGTLNSSDRTTGVFTLIDTSGGYLRGSTLKNFAIRITGSATTECVIYDCYIYWRVEPRNGKAFDTGLIDFGTPLAKQFYEIEFDSVAEASATVHLVVWGDLPGAMYARLDYFMFWDATRQVYRYPLANLFPGPWVEGKKIRILAFSTVKFQIFGVRVRMIEIPEYIDGGYGQTYRSQEMNYG